MSKKLLIKTKYNFLDEIDLESFCILKKKQFKKIVSLIHEHFDNGNTEIDVPVGNIGESIIFYDAQSVIDSDVMEVIELTEDEWVSMKFIFDGEFGECNLVRIYEALEDSQIVTEDYCEEPTVE